MDILRVPAGLKYVRSVEASVSPASNQVLIWMDPAIKPSTAGLCCRIKEVCVHSVKCWQICKLKLAHRRLTKSIVRLSHD